MGHQVLVGFIDVLPALNTLEQAKISKYNGWCSCDSRGAMDVNFMAFIVNHIVKVLSSSKYLHFLLLLIFLVHREMNGCLNALGEV